jgi:hypothetical protein
MYLAFAAGERNAVEEMLGEAFTFSSPDGTRGSAAAASQAATIWSLFAGGPPPARLRRAAVRTTLSGGASDDVAKCRRQEPLVCRAALSSYE